MDSFINTFDSEILFFIYAKLHFPLLDKLMILITRLGDNGLIWIALSLILLINKKTRIIGLLTLAALILNTIIGEGFLKPLFQRPRPYTDSPTTLLLIDRLTSYSFPSGHTSSSFAAAYVLSKYLKKYGLFFWGLAVLMAFSRLYLFMHYPTDVVAGIILGLFCGMTVSYLYERQIKKKEFGG